MSAPTFTGTKIIFGIPETNLPIRCPIAGKRRLVLSKKVAARLFVETAGGPREFILCDGGDHWFVDLKLEQTARNSDPATRHPSPVTSP